MPAVHISSYDKTVGGKVVHVNDYTVHRDAGDKALRHPGRPFMSAHPGAFPNGRSLPNVYPISKLHGASDGNSQGNSALPGSVPGSGAQRANQLGGGSGAPGTSAPVPDKLVATAAQKATLKAYLSAGYKAVNKALRSTKGNVAHDSHAPDLIAQVVRMDDILQRAAITSAMVVHHVINGIQGGGVSFPAKIPAGSALKDYGYFSATTSKSAAENAAGPKGAVVSTSVPAGAKGLRVSDVLPGSGDEILFPRESQLQVVSDTVQNGQRHIETQLVVDPENVITAEEAAKTTERAFAKARQRDRLS